MHSLPVFIRLAGETVLVLGDGDMADAKKRLVQRAGAVVTDNPAAPARFAFVATEDGEEAQIVATMLKARGMLVNVADRPELCDFTLPAIVDRDPVIIAVGTGGASAGLAKALRQRIENLLPNRLGELALALYDQRSAIRARWPTADERRRAIDTGLADGGAIDPLRDGAVDTVANWLVGEAITEGGIHHVLVTSDDPDDLTVRTVRLLGQADEIWHEPTVPAILLHRARADAKRIASAVPPSRDTAQGGKIIMWLSRT